MLTCPSYVYGTLGEATSLGPDVTGEVVNSHPQEAQQNGQEEATRECSSQQMTQRARGLHDSKQGAEFTRSEGRGLHSPRCSNSDPVLTLSPLQLTVPEPRQTEGHRGCLCKSEQLVGTDLGGSLD
ncbi:hypothetical protein P7K49_001061 [Saguinus oedipus]|uniref:Uncharacterized protein n=1 Tax=Saguinus oedipus TaxID=9490 RepID=A0ABQ9WDE3_SAGOE|nr:hypothetical protein P7K49_001061 [Saguinus oedipus]